jgi:hypothetical protein
VYTYIYIYICRHNSKGRTLKAILEAAASHTHFGYLVNGCVFLNELTPADRERLAWATAGNESLHARVKSACQTITMQHEDRVLTLSHNSAAYTPTTKQLDHKFLLSVIEGRIMKSVFTCPLPEPRPDILIRRDEMTVRAKLDIEKARKKVQAAAKKSDKWKKYVMLREERSVGRTTATSSIMKRKRTVFTQFKGKSYRRKSSSRANPK